MTKWIHQTKNSNGFSSLYKGYSFDESPRNVYDMSGEYCVDNIYTYNFWICNCNLKNREDWGSDNLFWHEQKVNSEDKEKCQYCNCKRPPIPKNKKGWW